ncbi:MAG: hypothetical protein ACK4QL_01025 [Pseudanabaenaceae cyanobacterium]
MSANQMLTIWRSSPVVATPEPPPTANYRQKDICAAQPQTPNTGKPPKPKPI